MQNTYKIIIVNLIILFNTAITESLVSIYFPVVKLPEKLLNVLIIAGAPEVIHGDVKTDSFCCVCDIPCKDLTYYAEYYGKIAIGFNSKVI